MKKFLFFGILSLGLSEAVSANTSKTCEDVGVVTVKKQLVISTKIGPVFIGEPQDFCVMQEANTQSVILASTLLSQHPSLAATAYRVGPKPVLDGLGERADRAYCRMLGGTYRLGNVVAGGWVDVDNDSGQSGMCVFADGSMVSSWTLFYKRYDPTSKGRPDFEPHFQNKVIEHPLW